MILKRPIIIGNVSGATGDRVDAMLKMLTGVCAVDAIVGDWLSEMNLSWKALEFFENPKKGYEAPFLHSFRLAAKEYVSKDVKLVVNAGAFNPRQLAIEVRKVLDATPHVGRPKTVAWVEGDDVYKQCLNSPEQIVHLHNGTTLKDWILAPFSANVYLGAWGIVKALDEGADIVITGRVTDASPVIGLAAWWHRWQQGDFDKLAHALAAGHLIECGPYVTGGNFPGFKRLLPDVFDLSHPIVEVSQDGTSIITKQPNQNGLVSIETVKTQFVYELQGPIYFNPDVVADFTDILFTPDGPDRVRVSNVKGLPAPPTLKVAVQARGGYQAEFSLHPVGLDIKEKVESVKIQINSMVKDDLDKGLIDVLEFQLYGTVPKNPTSQQKATTQLRVFIQAKSAEIVSKVARVALSSCLSGYPGWTMNMDMRTAQPKPFLELWPGLMPRSLTSQTVHFPERSISVAEPIPLLTPSQVPRQPFYEPTCPGSLARFGPTVRVPLGHVVYARSGDKGPNVNVGFFCAGRDEQLKWHWLRSFLTTAQLRHLLGEDNPKTGRIERCEFPGIMAVHFLIHGVLGTGVASTSVLDSLGKNVAEFIRAREVDVPSQFYDPRAKI